MYVCMYDVGTALSWAPPTSRSRRVGRMKEAGWYGREGDFLGVYLRYICVFGDGRVYMLWYVYVLSALRPIQPSHNRPEGGRCGWQCR